MKKETPMKMVAFQLEEYEVERLRKLAEKEESDVSKLLRKSTKLFLERHLGRYTEKLTNYNGTDSEL